METKGFKNWWFLALNGLVLLIFGLLILFFDQEQIKQLIHYFGIIVLVIGAILLLFGINNIRRDKSGTVILIESIAAIAIGLAFIFYPQASLALFLIMTGIWIIIVGIIQLVILVNIKRMLNNKNILLINGLLTVGLGVALLFNPFLWGVFLIKLIAVMAALFGLILICFSFILRTVKKIEETEKTVTPNN